MLGDNTKLIARQEDKAALRKAEAKRELERKRAAKVEDERRLEQERKAAEQQRLQEAKLAAQKQAEQRRAEEKQQRDDAAQKVKADAELVSRCCAHLKDSMLTPIGCCTGARKVASCASTPAW